MITRNETPLLLPKNPRPIPHVVAFEQANMPGYVAPHIRRIAPDIADILSQIAGVVGRKTNCSNEQVYRECVTQLIDALAQSIGCGAVLFDLNDFTDPTPSQAEPTNIIRLVA